MNDLQDILHIVLNLGANRQQPLSLLGRKNIVAGFLAPAHGDGGLCLGEAKSDGVLAVNKPMNEEANGKKLVTHGGVLKFVMGDGYKKTRTHPGETKIAAFQNFGNPLSGRRF